MAMKCPGCGAPMRLEAEKACLFCDYCGTIYYPDRNADGVRILGQASPYSCPVCATPLQQGALDEHPLAYCERCRGMLVEMPVFVDLIDVMRSRRAGPAATPHAGDPRDLNRKLACPGCHRPMNTHFYAGPGNIVIDDCSRCGWNWLDYGEITRIIAAPDRSYDEATTTF